MRSLLVFAVVLLAGGGYAARFADKVLDQHPQAQAAHVTSADMPRDPVSSGRSLMVEAGRDGHFAVQSRVNGVFTDFVVDTGASVVVLRETDAANAGLRPSPAAYTATVSTANGKAKAAPVKLDRVELGGITVYDVPALVMADDLLGKNLLGMAFLSRLRRYEVAGGRLVLEQ
ncbi:MAG TPA: TIGR02281 family clan AA aspartic protease [Pseudolabrys sp.]|nr:TIGR02281 family clan AA aspartic protease [Pseudolabrys sp.]